VMDPSMIADCAQLQSVAGNLRKGVKLGPVRGSQTHAQLGPSDKALLEDMKLPQLPHNRQQPRLSKGWDMERGSSG
jgi:hypothetical protein